MNLIGLAKTCLHDFRRQAHNSGLVAQGGKEFVSFRTGLKYTQPDEDFEPVNRDIAHSSEMKLLVDEQWQVDMDEVADAMQLFIGQCLGYAAESVEKSNPHVRFSFNSDEDTPFSVFLDLRKGEAARIPFQQMAQKLDELEELLFAQWRDHSEGGVKIKQFASPEEKALALEFIGLLSKAFGASDELLYNNVFDTDGNAILMSAAYLETLRAREHYIEM